MTPKEKCYDLIDKVSDWSDYETMNDLKPKKELALICVNEMLKFINSNNIGINESEYWREVKKEIQEL